MANYHKGNIYEGEVKRILESMGWSVEGQHRKAMYIPDFKHKNPVTGKPNLKLIMSGRDVFGSDIIAKKAGEKTLWIQVGVREMRMKKIRQIAPFPWNYECDTVEVWCRTEGKREYERWRAPGWESVGILAVPKDKPKEKVIDPMTEPGDENAPPVDMQTVAG